MNNIKNDSPDIRFDKKMQLCLFTASGASILRRDLIALKYIRKIQKDENILMTSRLRAILFPWSIKKIKIALGLSFTPSLEKGIEDLLDKEIPLSTINLLFSQSSIYQRLAAMDYEKAKKNHVLIRQNQLIKKRKKVEDAKKVTRSI